MSRTLLDMSTLDSIPELAWLHEGVSGPRNVIEFGGNRVIVLYLCRSGTLLNVVIAVEDPHQADPGLSYASAALVTIHGTT